jgi:hypothetical protein
MKMTGQLHFQAANYRQSFRLGAKPLEAHDQRLGGRQSVFGHCGEEKILTLPGIETGSTSCSQSLY